MQKTTTIEVEADEKEVEVVKHLSLGHTVKQVASITGISKRTLDGMVARMKLKYASKSIAGICVKFYQNKLID